MVKQERMRELINLLKLAANAYYNTSDPVMTDKEYDTYFDEIVKLEKETGIIYTDSVTQNVGAEVKSKLDKIEHEYPMLSLGKTKAIEQLEKFLGNKKGLLTDKLDGLTTVLTYLNGKLVSAITRGNGYIGCDVLFHVKQYKNIPLVIPYLGKLVVRGESIISYENFKRINIDSEYSNPRNLVSGTLNNLDSNLCKDRNVEFIAFEVVEGFNDYSKKSLQLTELKNMGFSTVHGVRINSDDLDEEALKDTDSRYPTDGKVLTFDDVEYSKSLGSTGHHPLHSIAYKWADTSYETTFRSIEWQVGRTGVITPVAVFDEVDLDGAVTTRASLHNLDIMDSLELGKGDTLTIYRANMVIPQVEDNLTRSNMIKYPTKCPVCGGEVGIKQVNARFLQCLNPNCQAKLIQKLSHFVSRDCMNIDGLSEATLEKFVAKGWIKDLDDIYRLDTYESEIKHLEGFGVKSYNNLIKSIEKSKTVKLENFISALGIEGVGKNSSKLLSKQFKTINGVMDAGYSQILTIDGLGDVAAESITKYFNTYRTLVINLLNFINIECVSNDNKMDDKLQGKTFVITGNVHIYENRKALQAKIESLGGKVADSVSKNSDYLINNDTESNSSKNKKAKELGVKIISEEDFLNIIK